MKFIGQYIQQFIARFRNDVYLEDISTGTIASGANLGLDSNNKIVKNNVSGGSDTNIANTDLTFTGSRTLNLNGDDFSINTGNLVEINTSDFEVTTNNATRINSSVSSKPLFELKNTTNDANGAALRFVKDKGAAGADNDISGQIEFYADDSLQQQTLFARIQGVVKDASNTAEEGKLTLSVASHDAELKPGIILQSGNAEDEVDVFLGSTTSSLTVVNGRLAVTSELDLSTNLKFSTTDGAPQNIFDAEDETIATIDAGGFTTFKAAGNLDIGTFDFRAQTFTSDVTTGTAPFTVSSTTEVANLRAATATNLAASTSTAVQLGTIELGHASDTTIARSAAGTATIEGKEVVTINKMRDVHTVAYHHSTNNQGHYLTMSGATTSDSTFLSPASFHLMRVMPYDGKIIRITCFNQSTSSRSESFKLYIDGNDNPLSANRGSELTFTSNQKGSADCPSDWTFSAGESISIRRQPSIASQGTNITIVFEFDMTT